MTTDADARRFFARCDFAAQQRLGVGSCLLCGGVVGRGSGIAAHVGSCVLDEVLARRVGGRGAHAFNDRDRFAAELDENRDFAAEREVRELDDGGGEDRRDACVRRVPAALQNSHPGFDRERVAPATTPRRPRTTGRNVSPVAVGNKVEHNSADKIGNVNARARLFVLLMSHLSGRVSMNSSST